MAQGTVRPDEHYNSGDEWLDRKVMPLEIDGSIAIEASHFKHPKPELRPGLETWEVAHNRHPLTLTFYGPKGGISAIFYLSEKDAGGLASALERAVGLLKRVKSTRRGHRAPKTTGAQNE